MRTKKSIVTVPLDPSTANATIMVFLRRHGEQGERQRHVDVNAKPGKKVNWRAPLAGHAAQPYFSG